MKRRGFLTAFVLSMLFFLSLPFAQDQLKTMPLGWDHKDGETLFHFQELKRYQDKMMINIGVQNKNKTDQCIFVTTGPYKVLMDDNAGNKYIGATIEFKTSETNKLTPDENMIIGINLPAPKKGVSTVNFHFGLFSKAIGKNQKCADPIVKTDDYNFHKTNVNVSKIQ